MKRLQILAYSIGHFMNDLCSAMWFTFLLIFLEKVVMLTSTQAGFLMLLGQVRSI
jgi:Na+/melibiose symporter-like transporter